MSAADLWMSIASFCLTLGLLSVARLWLSAWMNGRRRRRWEEEAREAERESAQWWAQFRTHADRLNKGGGR